MKVIPLGEAKARLGYYGRVCQSEPVIVTVKGVPAFQMASLDEYDGLTNRLLERDPRFRNYVKKCLRTRSIPSAEALRKLR